MPQFKVTGPDGKSYVVNAPEGASQDDVLAYVKQNYAQAGSPQQDTKPSGDSYSPDQLAQAFYQASDAGDQDAQKQIFQQIQAQGAKLRPRNTAELDRAQGIASQGVVNDMSGPEKFFAGAGKSVLDNFHGAQQIGSKIASFLPFVGDDAQAKYDQLKAQQSNTNVQDAPLLHSGAGLAGNIAGQIGQAVAGGSILKGLTGGASLLGNGYAATAASGGLQGAIQPLDSDQSESSRALNTALGSAAGVAGRGLLQGGAQLVRNGAQTVAGLLLPKASPEVANLASSAINDYGIPLKASQVVPSRVAKTLDSVSAKVPFSGAQDFAATQQKAFNRAVAGTIGEDTDQITPAIYAQAKKRIGGVYDDITARNQVGITPDVQNSLASVLQDAQQTGSDDSVKAVTSLLGRIGTQAVDGQLPGDAYQSIQSQLGNIAKSGGEKANYAGQIRGILRGALNDSISPEDQAAWQAANQQYGNLKTIRNLVTKDAVNGDISPAQLLGRVTANNAGKEAVASGRGGDLGQLASIGQTFLKDGVPNSGTPERLAAYGLLGAGGWANLPGALSTVAGARGYQSLMQSPQLLAKVLQDPSIDQATKSAIISRLGAGGGLLGQQGVLADRRVQASPSGYAPALLRASP